MDDAGSYKRTLRSVMTQPHSQGPPTISDWGTTSPLDLDRRKYPIEIPVTSPMSRAVRSSGESMCPSFPWCYCGSTG